MRSINRPHPRLGLLGTFALVSAVPVLLLGLVLATVLGSQIRDRSMDSTVSAAELATRAGVGTVVSRQELRSGKASKDTKAALARVIDPSDKVLPFARVNVWTKDKGILASSDPALDGKSIEPSDELEEALKGESEVEVIHAADKLTTEPENRSILKKYGDLLEVYVPILRKGKTIGAFEVYLPDKRIANAVSADTNRLYLILIVGLSLLYAIVFRLVARASRQLRIHGREMSAVVDRIRYESEHDPLTHLANRTLFRSRSVDALVAARRSGERAALLLIDLDRFKEINDTLGHQTGDLLLQAIGPRLEKMLRPSDTLARLGGDEFGILLTQIPDIETALIVARGAHKMLEQPFVVQGLTLDVEASIGIALFPDHAEDFEELMQHADVAMYQAKGKRTGYEVYEQADGDGDASRLKLAGDLREAVGRHELVLHYQPKVDLRSGRVVGAEALMRWHHPGQGMIMPDRFIPLAERSGLIRSLTVFAIETAVRECRRWIEARAALSVSVNLSTRDLIDIQLPDEVDAAAEPLARARVEPRARDHRERADGRPDPRPRGRRPAARPGREGLDRRLRLGLLVARLPQPAGRERPEDRQVVRAEHDRERGRRADRAVDDRPRPQPRAPGGGRGGRDPGRLRPPAHHGLRHRPGLLHQPPGAGLRSASSGCRRATAAAHLRAA